MKFFKKSIVAIFSLMITLATVSQTIRADMLDYYMMAVLPSVAQNKHAKILFLHHSTGGVIYDGGVVDWIEDYNRAHGTSYTIHERHFPSGDPYPWDNYPYDYWNIWINHAGNTAYMEEPTLEMLTPEYDLIVWKHCFPVSGIDADTGYPDITSSSKRLENYYLQYNALRLKMRSFPRTKFLVWTGAALTEASTTEPEAQRAQTFFNWVKNSWDERGDNIFLWDFYILETEGGLYLLPKYAQGTHDSHPNATLADSAAPLFGQRMVDVIEGRGDSGSLTGE